MFTTMNKVALNERNVKSHLVGINKASAPVNGDKAVGGIAETTIAGDLIGAGRGGGEAVATAPSYSFNTCDQLGNFHNETNVKLANSLEKCGRVGEATKVLGCCQDFKVGICEQCGTNPAFPISCDNRLCPGCAKRRAERLVSEHSEMLKRLHYPKMITLTFLSTKHLTFGDIKRYRDMFTRLRHKKVFRSCWGGIYSFEFTYSEEYGWHPHIHAVVGSKYINQAELSVAWEKVSGASVVDIRAIKTPDKWNSIREVIKYPAKSSTFINNPELVNEFLNAVKGTNLAHGFGSMKRVKTKRHQGKMSCPVCGYDEVSFKHGFGFLVPRVKVKTIVGGYIWRGPPKNAELVPVDYAPEDILDVSGGEGYERN